MSSLGYIKESNIITMPKTERGIPGIFEMTFDKKYLVFSSFRTLFLLDMNNLEERKSFTKHSSVVVGFGIHPSETLIYSIDSQGKLLIWDYNTFEIKEERVISVGFQIRGVIVGNSSKFVIIYGNDGNVKILNMENPNIKMGDIKNFQKAIYTGIVTKDENPLLFLAGEDMSLGTYKGVPFETQDIDMQLTKKFITTMRLSPDGKTVLIGGMEKSIWLYDAATGKMIEQITKDKEPGNHSLSIMSLAWVDDSHFVTGSLDKTVKLWDLKEKKCVLTLKIKEKPTIDNMVNNIVTNGKVVNALCLNGEIHQWNLEDAKDGQLPNKTIYGPQGSLKFFVYKKPTNEVFVTDIDGKVYKVNEKGEYSLLCQKGKAQRGMTISQDYEYLYFIDSNENIVCNKIEDGTELWRIDVSAEKFKLSQKNSDCIYILNTNTIFICNKEKVIQKEKLKFRANCFDINEDKEEALIGDDKGNIHVLSLKDLKETSKITGHYSSVLEIAYSPDKKYIVSSETDLDTQIRSEETKEIVAKYRSHYAKVIDIAWKDNSIQFFTSGLDGRIILFDVSQKKIIKEYLQIDLNYISKVIPLNEDSNDFLCLADPNMIYKIKTL